MRRHFATIAALALAGTLAGAGSAAAQDLRRRVPDTGMTGVSFSTGVTIPRDDSLQTGPTLIIKGERYVTPRVSVRGLFGGSWNDITGRGFAGTSTPITMNGNVVYNWEGGKVHPYVTGGVGWYHYRFEEAQIKDTANKFGLNFGGGVEWFISRRDSITGEVLYHAITDDEVRAPLTLYKPSFWTIAGGYKKYF
jgi:Outer membrane protein beta-barrel domain